MQIHDYGFRSAFAYSVRSTQNLRRRHITTTVCGPGSTPKSQEKGVLQSLLLTDRLGGCNTGAAMD